MSAERVDDVPRPCNKTTLECVWDEGTIAEVVNGIGQTLETKSQVPIRIAVTGKRVGLPLFKPMEILQASKCFNKA